MVKDSNNLSSDPLLFLIGNFDLELKSVISILSESNYQFIKAPTFESGMHQSKIPDLILIESSQLEQNGINFFSKIKADPGYRRTPVVVLSANLVSPERQFQIIQQGAASVVCSPIHPFELLGSVFAELRNLSEIAALKKSEHDCMVGKKVEGLTIREAYTRTESGKVPEILDEVERSGEPFVSKETPYSIKGDDGKSRPMWVNEWFYPFLNLDGKVTGILGMAQDVTEQVQARHEVSSVLNSLPAFITRVDLHKRIIFINHSNEKYFG